MKKIILEKIKLEKQKYKLEGFLIVGIFGSFARLEENLQSDLDILYELSNEFLSSYDGWDLYFRINQIKLELENALNLHIDLANKDALDDVGKYFILQDLVYVP
jgi:uncharacterized protein